MRWKPVNLLVSLHELASVASHFSSCLNNHWMLFALPVVMVTDVCYGNVRFVSPQCCHGVAQLMYNSAEQQGAEEVGQLTGGQIDTRDLTTEKKRSNH